MDLSCEFFPMVLLPREHFAFLFCCCCFSLGLLLLFCFVEAGFHCVSLAGLELLRRLGLSCTHKDAPGYDSQVLELKAHATMPGPHFYYINFSI